MMNTEKSAREIIEEWNGKAKARGELIEQDPWSLPVLYHGSILDVPVTTEAEERIRQLDALIARLEQENTAAVTTEQNGARDQAQETSSPISSSGPNTEAQLNTRKS
jgi:hypothetical protein